MWCVNIPIILVYLSQPSVDYKIHICCICPHLWRLFYHHFRSVNGKFKTYNFSIQFSINTLFYLICWFDRSKLNVCATTNTMIKIVHIIRVVVWIQNFVRFNDNISKAIYCIQYLLKYARDYLIFWERAFYFMTTRRFQSTETIFV